MGVVSVLLLGCKQEATGVHVHAHMTGLTYDELRFGVVLLPPDGSLDSARTIVDPDTRGRYRGPFKMGDQDVVIYLTDDAADQLIRCQAIALAQGTVIASGAVQVVAPSQMITDVDIYLSASNAPERGGGQPTSMPPTSTGATSPGNGGGTGGAGGAPVIAQADASAPAGGSGGARGSGGAIGSGGARGSGGANGSGGAGGSGGAAGGPGPGQHTLGMGCKQDSECQSGHCADEVCCQSDCAGTCQSCRLGGSQGLCTNIPAGMHDMKGSCMDLHPTQCQTDGFCDGHGGCALYPSGTACSMATCLDSNDKKVPADTCDGNGACIDRRAAICKTMCDGADGGDHGPDPTKNASGCGMTMH